MSIVYVVPYISVIIKCATQIIESSYTLKRLDIFVTGLLMAMTGVTW